MADGDSGLIIRISIHPPRVGRDVNLALSLLLDFSISIHPPRVGRDPAPQHAEACSPAFQSTLPVWGGTLYDDLYEQIPQDFNPPSPCGEGLLIVVLAVVLFIFQSTLPVWGGTACPNPLLPETLRFQSTLPVWGGTCW